MFLEVTFNSYTLLFEDVAWRSTEEVDFLGASGVSSAYCTVMKYAHFNLFITFCFILMLGQFFISKIENEILNWGHGACAVRLCAVIPIKSFFYKYLGLLSMFALTNI